MSDAKTPSAQKIYTRGGDAGETSLIGGLRVSKGELRLEAYGTVDEFNSALGLAICLFARDSAEKLSSTVEAATATAIPKWATDLQSRLFDLGSQLACEDEGLREKLPTVRAENVEALENQMDEMSRSLAPLRHFVLPGGTTSAAAAHVARTVCRRAERLCVRLSETESIDPMLIQFLNRASDWCFVLSRFMNAAAHEPEQIWIAKREG